MDRSAIIGKILETFDLVGELCDQDWGKVTESTVPMNDLKDFDSHLALETSLLLEETLQTKVEIPRDIFIVKDDLRASSIGDIADQLKLLLG